MDGGWRGGSDGPFLNVREQGPGWLWGGMDGCLL